MSGLLTGRYIKCDDWGQFRRAQEFLFSKGYRWYSGHRELLFQGRNDSGYPTYIQPAFTHEDLPCFVIDEDPPPSSRELHVVSSILKVKPEEIIL